MDIKNLRLERGWSQEQLAEMSGLSARTIQRLENGDSSSAETLKSLAAVFEIPLTELRKDQTSNGQGDHILTKRERQVAREIAMLKGFYIHLFTYLVVMTGLLVINLITSTQTLWVVWPALGWGIGIAFHAFFTYRPYRRFTYQWEQREFEKRMQRRPEQR